MYSHEFPSCCGASILASLDDFAFKPGLTFEETQFNRMKELIRETPSQSWYAITNDSQETAEKNLDKLGFTVVHKWLSHETWNTLKTWFMESETEKYEEDENE